MDNGSVRPDDVEVEPPRKASTSGIRSAEESTDPKPGQSLELGSDGWTQGRKCGMDPYPESHARTRCPNQEGQASTPGDRRRKSDDVPLVKQAWEYVQREDPEVLQAIRAVRMREKKVIDLVRTDIQWQGRLGPDT